MMKFVNVWLVISRIIVFCRSENPPEAYDSRSSREVNDDFKHSESRYRLRNTHREYDEWENGRKDPYLSDAFRAPRYEAQDYWNEELKKSALGNRRTFFDSDYVPHEKRTTAPGFYQFVTSLFSGRDVTPKPRDPTNILQPFGHPNYLPPSKPIRASVIKLETITRSPILFPSFHYDSTTQYFPHIESILNHVLIENSKKHHHYDLSFHYQGDSIAKLNPVTPPVLPRPIQLPPTTLRPILRRTKPDPIQNEGISYYNTTLDHPKNGYKYPESVQDQLPILKGGSYRIPYVSETTIADIPTTLFPTIKYDNKNPEIDVRSFSWVTANIPEREGVKNSTNTPESTRRSKNFVPLKKSRKNSVEIITALTVEGLKKVQNENANIHNYVNYFNTENLINYEMGKLKNSLPLDNLRNKSLTTHADNTTVRAVNLNDELSLDAKILKDTQWDGIGTTKPPVTQFIEEITETTKPFQIEPRIGYGKTNEITLLEVTDDRTDSTPITTEAAFANETETSSSITSTTEYPSTETTETSLKTTTDKMEEKSTVTDTPIPETTKESLQKMAVDLVVTTTAKEKLSSPPPKRKYHRRAKVVNFTPYPTVNELQKKSLNRNHFPKRQKPNITLTFGNKNILKNRDTYPRDEVMKFSDEDVTKRIRKLGKRRQVIKRMRVLTSERPLQK